MAEPDWVGVVADQRCEECGLRAAEVPRPALRDALRQEAANWRTLLSRDSAEALAAHPAPGWSALEYGAYVRDVLRNFADRVERALAEDDPVLGWWDHEAAAIEERYNDQDSRDVGAAIEANGERLAALTVPLRDPQWRRTATRRPGETFTAEGLVRFALHEAHHHYIDADDRVALAEGVR